MPFQPVNGHIHVVMCQDPANMNVGKLVLANLGKRGVFISKVVAVDETPIYDSNGVARDRPHICKPGDVVYCRDSDVGIAFKMDGGTEAYTIREMMLSGIESGVEAKVLSLADIEELKKQRKEEDERLRRENQMSQNAAIARNIGLVQG